MLATRGLHGQPATQLPVAACNRSQASTARPCLLLPFAALQAALLPGTAGTYLASHLLGLDGTVSLAIHVARLQDVRHCSEVVRRAEKEAQLKQRGGLGLRCCTEQQVRSRRTASQHPGCLPALLRLHRCGAKPLLSEGKAPQTALAAFLRGNARAAVILSSLCLTTTGLLAPAG